MAINQVPASMLADLNGDGKPDAYWGRLSFIRRMDDNGNVNNPEWAHSYSWGPVWYWAAREAQGQIGWPGVPVTIKLSCGVSCNLGLDSDFRITWDSLSM